LVYGFWVENTLDFSVVGKRISILFKGFTSHEFVRVCKILQSLQANTQQKKETLAKGEVFGTTIVKNVFFFT
jgi:hypothetical protein